MGKLNEEFLSRLRSYYPKWLEKTKEVKKKLPIDDKCTCDEKDHEEETCPYAIASQNDHTLCKCCPYCRNECNMDS